MNVLKRHPQSCTLSLAPLAKRRPFCSPALGGLWSERSGVINFTLEGMMLGGAFAGRMGELRHRQSVGGGRVRGTLRVCLDAVLRLPALPGLVLRARGASRPKGTESPGLVLAGAHGVASLHLRVNQIVSAMALNIFALGATGSLMEHVFGTVGTSPSVAKLPSVPLAGGRVGVLTILAVAVAVTSGFLLYRTRWGLRVRATGEDPGAASAVGVPVLRLKWACVLASGVLAGLAGAHLSTGDLSQFQERMTDGRGYIAVAAVIFGRWRPGGVALACFLFGLADAFGENLQGVRLAGWPVSPEWALMVPFLVTLAALAGLVGRSVPPRGLGEMTTGEG